GELANTLVIVTADNGTSLPRAKANVYDWGVHVPLAMMWPARVPDGRTVSDFVGFPDLAPTIL
ncbi:MAG TPA: sulfatase, partial [Planctomycetaceae bacterium]|nr:sulfatase [Planctomycetaceae bacterium]